VTQTSFRTLIRGYYGCTVTKCGVWNGAIMESSWRARARTQPSLYGPLRYVLFRLSTPYGAYACLQFHRLPTYPFTYTYKTTHLLLDASHGHRTIPYCCLLLSSLSRCGIQRFAGPYYYHSEFRGLSTPLRRLVFASEQSRPTRKQSQQLRGYPMDLGSFPVHKIERSSYG
jgi:hypothetical protein